METIRKEVRLVELWIPPLQKAADMRGWSLKKYMEYVLAKESSRLEQKFSAKSKK